jgi:hypothetical protein
MPQRPRRRTLPTLVLASLALAAPGTAPAATVEVGPDGILYRAAPGERNDVRMNDTGGLEPRRSVVEASALLVLGPGCESGTPVLCGDRFDRVDVLRLGDRDDRASDFTNFADTYVHGGAGDDDLLSGGGNAFGWGGRGDDRVDASSNGQSQAVGGPGDDILTGRGPGSDILLGGRGDDRLVQASTLVTAAWGGPGDDRIELHGRGAAPGGRFDGGVRGGRGDDRVLAAQGAADTIDCGRGFDRVDADAADAVAPDCERVAIVPSG